MKKKILIIVDHFLPGYNAGGPIQSIANLTKLLKDTYDFWILTKNNDFLAPEPYKDVVSDKWTIREEGIQVFYLSKEKRTYSYFKRIIKELDFDLIYCNSLYSPIFSGYSLLACKLNKPNVQKVLAPRGELQAGAIKIRYPKKITYIQAFKLLGLHKNMVWHATDAQEKEDVKKYFGQKSIARVSANVPKLDQLPWTETPKEEGSVRFAFIARLAPKKNILFFIQQLKYIKGNIQFDVYGILDDPQYWKECEAAIQALPKEVKVAYKGAIPNHTVLKTLQNYHFYILSTWGENFGHSIFEGLLAGRPVMISDKTPWRDLQAKNIGWDIPLADTDVWQKEIQRTVYMSSKEFNTMSKDAWHFAKNYIDLDAIKKTTIHLFE